MDAVPDAVAGPMLGAAPGAASGAVSGAVPGALERRRRTIRRRLGEVPSSSSGARREGNREGSREGRSEGACEGSRGRSREGSREGCEADSDAAETFTSRRRPEAGLARSGLSWRYTRHAYRARAALQASPRRRVHAALDVPTASQVIPSRVKMLASSHAPMCRLTQGCSRSASTYP